MQGVSNLAPHWEELLDTTNAWFLPSEILIWLVGVEPEYPDILKVPQVSLMLNYGEKHQGNVSKFQGNRLNFTR